MLRLGLASAMLALGIGGCAHRSRPVRAAEGSPRLEVIEIRECSPGLIQLSNGTCLQPVNPGTAEIEGTPPSTPVNPPRTPGPGDPAGCETPECKDSDPPFFCQGCAETLSAAGRACRAKGATRTCLDCMQEAAKQCESCMTDAQTARICTVWLQRHPHYCQGQGNECLGLPAEPPGPTPPVRRPPAQPRKPQQSEPPDRPRKPPTAE
jgi:hypothetical protein